MSVARTRPSCRSATQPPPPPEINEPVYVKTPWRGGLVGEALGVPAGGNDVARVGVPVGIAVAD
jgi:hypothetical protein